MSSLNWTNSGGNHKHPKDPRWESYIHSFTHSNHHQYLMGIIHTTNWLCHLKCRSFFWFWELSLYMYSVSVCCNANNVQWYFRFSLHIQWVHFFMWSDAHLYTCTKKGFLLCAKFFREVHKSLVVSIFLAVKPVLVVWLL